MMSRNQYRLGGIPTRRWAALRKRTQRVLIALGVIAAGLQLTTQSVWLLLALLAVGGIGFWVWNRPSLEGTRWLTRVVGERARRTLARLGRWDEYDPAHDPRPWTLFRHRIREHHDGPCGIIDTGGRLATVLRIDGDGSGIRDDWYHTRREGAWTQVLDALAAPASGVCQIDIITNVRPASAQPHADWLDEHRGPDMGPTVTLSGDELHASASNGAEYHTWAVIHMDVADLARKVREWGLKADDEETLADAARQTTRAAARTLETHGWPVLDTLTANQIAAACRAILDPDHHPDDTTGCDQFWNAWPAYQSTPLGDATITYDPSDESRRARETGESPGRWYHAAAGIDRDDYPIAPQQGRWLAPITLEAHDIPWRTITIKCGLVRHREARKIAHDRGTDQDAQRVHKERKGVRPDGTVEQALSVADSIAEQITTQGHAGIILGVTIDVAARHAVDLRRGREHAERAVEQHMGATLTWHDGRQAQGTLHAMPIAVPVR